MQATHSRRVRNAAPSTPGRQSSPDVAAARRTAKGHCTRAWVWRVGPGEHAWWRAMQRRWLGGDHLLYYGRVHVHRGNPILAHDGAGLLLQKRNASVEQSGKQAQG